RRGADDRRVAFGRVLFEARVVRDENLRRSEAGELGGGGFCARADDQDREAAAQRAERLPGERDGGVSRLLDLAVRHFGDHEYVGHRRFSSGFPYRTLASVVRRRTRSATSATLMPALREGGG